MVENIPHRYISTHVQHTGVHMCKVHADWCQIVDGTQIACHGLCMAPSSLFELLTLN